MPIFASLLAAAAGMAGDWRSAGIACVNMKAFIAIVGHIALNLLKTFPAKMSVARKRRRCTYDDQFLADVLLSIHA